MIINTYYFKKINTHSRTLCIVIFTAIVLMTPLQQVSAETNVKNQTTSNNITTSSNKPLSQLQANTKKPGTQQKTSKEYQKRLLGDTALDSGLYDIAMNYYKNYLKDAEGNSPAIRDAYFCLIATCLRSNNLNEANRLYNELKTKFQVFFKNNPLEQRTLEYWAAEILFKEGYFKKAEVKFENILKNIQPNEKELATSTLIGLGIVKVRQEKWQEAKKIFLRLKKDVNTAKVIDLANQQLTFINIILGNTIEAKRLIPKSRTSKKQLTTQFRLLQVYTLVKEKKYPEALQKYNQLRKVLSPPNTVWYILADSFANSYIKAKNYKNAIPLLKDSIIAAPDTYYSEKSNLALINTLLAAGQLKQAANTSIFFLDHFPDTVIKDKVLLCLTELLIKQKRYKDAANYTSKYLVLTKPVTSEKIRIAYETGQALLRIKEYGNALKYFNYTADNGTNSVEKGKGKYWIAETILLENKYEQALLLFNKLKENSYWKEKSTFKIAQIYLEQKKVKKAAVVLSSLLSNYPKSKLQPSPAFLYAVTLRELGKDQDAIADFIKFAKNNPMDINASRAYFEAGCLSINNCNYKQGIDYLLKILTNYQDSDKIPSVLYRLLYANYLEGNYKTAQKYAKRLIKQYPNSKFILQTLLWQVNYYRNNKEYDKALNALIVLQKQFSKKPLIISEILYNKAYILNLKGESTDALNTISKVENSYSTTPILSECLFLKGDILSSDGNYLDAASCYLKATQTTKNQDLNNAAWGRVGDCYFAKINYDKKTKKELLLNAIKYYNKILDSDNLSPLFKIQTLYKIGKCYQLLDKNEKAITMFHEAVYGIILNIKHGENPSTEWFAKSAIALAKLLQERNTPVADKAAIDVYKTLIKYNIQPVQEFKLRIQKINNNYKLKE